MIQSGYNVYPAEIERVLANFPKIYCSCWKRER